MTKTKKNKTSFKRIIAIVSFISIFSQSTFVFAATLTLSELPVSTSTSTTGGTVSPNSGNSLGSAAQNKGNMPTISVSFDKNPPVAGEKITALAAANGFLVTGGKDLYYTWYLRRNHEGGTNDWKVNAAKILAKGNYESGDVTRKDAIKDEHTKGYTAVPAWGTNDSSADAKNCYMSDLSTGRVYEISSSENTWNCPVGTSPQCVRDRTFSEILFRDNPPTANALCDATCAKACTYEVTENNPAYCETPTDPADTCATEPKTITVKKTKPTMSSCQTIGVPTCETKDNENFETVAKCEQLPAGSPFELKDASGNVIPFEPKCIKGTTFSYNEKNNDTQRQASVCSIFTGSSTGELCSSANMSKEPVLIDLVTPDPEGKVKCLKGRGENKCEHIFPDIGTGTLGDGTFRTDENNAWGMNPNIISTKGNGQTDEANLIGLNANSFTWTYQEGDEVGVVVEGPTADPSKHDDSSYIITWAFSKNSCSAFTDFINGIPFNKRQFYNEQQNTPTGNTETNSTGIINVTGFLIDECLSENLIDPKSGGIGQLEVNIDTKSSAIPKNIPKDESLVSDGDIIKAVATVTNVARLTNDFNYNWTVEISDNGTSSPSNDKWLATNFTTLSEAKGIGNDKFEFKLDDSIKEAYIKNNEAYIRVKVIVTESGGALRMGKGTKIIKISNPGMNIEPRHIVIENGVLKMCIKADPSRDKTECPICSSDNSENTCDSIIPVIQNEIIGLKMSDKHDNISQIVWKYNGEILSCDDSVSPDCDQASNLKQFIPITGTVGTVFEVSATVKMKNSTQSQEFLKKFKVVEPSIVITSVNDNAIPKITGFTKDFSGETIPVTSKKIFKAYFGKELEFKATTTPSFIEKNIKYQWKNDGVDGAVVDSTTPAAERNLVFSTKEGQNIYQVNINAVYTQTDDVRQVLQNAWGINAFNSREIQMSDSVQVEANYEEYQGVTAMSKFGPRQFFASALASLPGETFFLLKTLLSSLLIILATGAVFSIIPNANMQRRE